MAKLNVNRRTIEDWHEPIICYRDLRRKTFSNRRFYRHFLRQTLNPFFFFFVPLRVYIEINSRYRVESSDRKQYFNFY